MIIRNIEIEKFRAFENVTFDLGKRITAIAGRNATQKTTVLGMIGQPFTISSKDHQMYGCKTIDGYNFRSQFKEKFKLSPEHDIIGEHKWTLNFHNGFYENNYFSVKSIARVQRGKPDTLRFWNAESRARGAGYIQLPVYFLSLSRLFPIGEVKKTKEFPIILTEEEKEYCINNYRTILSIQNRCTNSDIGIEKGAASKSFAGISDDIHDIYTNSAGESNIVKIILALLSFKRLKDEYRDSYKGGILLIDELDATLYGFSQTKLVDYLWQASAEFKVQIIFTTHSPLVLKRVNKYQREERKRKGISLPIYAYDSAIVYLQPQYNEEGERTIMPKNISTSVELKNVLDDINLVPSMASNKLNIYCEDQRAIDFVQYILSKTLSINLDAYMSFVDIDLGWTNYVQLAEKRVPEFCNNMIILDGDVLNKPEFRARENFIRETKNFLFLPLVIEEDIFKLLKNHAAFIRFKEGFSNVPTFTYDICFNNWPLKTEMYGTKDFKEWYKQIENILGNQNILFDFWCSEYTESMHEFSQNFCEIFNRLAEKNEFDIIPGV